MKKIFTFIFCMVSLAAHAQQWESITFDPGDTLYPKLIVIDTINYHHNIWQIGKPDKTVFTSAHSVPNAIVTDTANAYPVNDTSVFILKLPAWVPNYPGSTWYGPLYIMSFVYQLNMDSNAIARVEVSEDSGAHWANFIDSLPDGYAWDGDTPNLSVSTNGWTNFQIYRDEDIWHVPTTDTILFRFTFISDTIQANKDGWMIDDIQFVYYFESIIPLIENNNLFSVYPNPSQGDMYIHANEQNIGKASVSVCDMAGREVYKSNNIPANDYLNLSLPDGMYILKYSTDKEFATKRIVIRR